MFGLRAVVSPWPRVGPDLPLAPIPRRSGPLEFPQNQGRTATGRAALRIVSFASRLSKRGCPQANRVTLTKFCRCNNLSGDGFAHHVRLASVL